jgi:hypothetical protein
MTLHVLPDSDSSPSFEWFHFQESVKELGRMLKGHGFSRAITKSNQYGFSRRGNAGNYFVSSAVNRNPTGTNSVLNSFVFSVR